jgi:hypothetical protein
MAIKQGDGTFPTFKLGEKGAEALDKNGQPIRLPVSPNDRCLFMQQAGRVSWGVQVTATTHGTGGKPSSTVYPAVATVGPKRFSSGNHGLYGEIQGVRTVMIDGTEYELGGSIMLMLKKRHA